MRRNEGRGSERGNNYQHRAAFPHPAPIQGVTLPIDYGCSDSDTHNKNKVGLLCGTDDADTEQRSACCHKAPHL